MIIIKIIALILILAGVVFSYDARIISNYFFSFGDQNEATSGLKILGFIMAIVGGLVVLFLSK